jgi:hypothetical protein
MRIVGAKRISFLQLVKLFMVIISMLTQQSCIKDEFTIPVRISLSVMINEQYKTDGTLSFQSGEIVVKEVRFEGKREVGEDYSFNTESGKEFGPLDFYPQSVTREEIASFDFPQGIYTLMSWKFELSDGLERFEPDDDYSETPGLILDGNYINPEGDALRIIIEIEPFESFECLSITETGDKIINIISGTAYEANLYLDPYFAFRAISNDSLDDADCSDDDIPVILISSDSNEELYEIFLYRLQQSAKIVVS